MLFDLARRQRIIAADLGAKMLSCSPARREYFVAEEAAPMRVDLVLFPHAAPFGRRSAALSQSLICSSARRRASVASRAGVHACEVRPGSWIRKHIAIALVGCATGEISPTSTR